DGAGEEAHARPRRVQVVHLPVHLADHEGDVLAPAQRAQGRAGGDLDARRRRVRRAGRALAVAAVPPPLRVGRDPDGPDGTACLARASSPAVGPVRWGYGAGRRRARGGHRVPRRLAAPAGLRSPRHGARALSAATVDPADVMPRLAVDYLDADLAALLREPDVLAVLGCGESAPRSDDPRYFTVALEPHGTAPLEVCRAGGAVTHGRADGVACASDGVLQFGAIEIDEPGDDDIGTAADEAYRRMLGFIDARGFPHLLRIWNYLD